MANLKVQVSDEINFQQQSEEQNDQFRRTSEESAGCLERYEKAFEEAQTSWGGNSGEGSAPEACLPYTRFLKEFYSDAEVVDIGFGDLRMWGTLGPCFRKYTGIEVLSSCVRDARMKHDGRPGLNFYHGLPYDFKSEIRAASLVMVKDVLQHLPLHQLRVLLEFLRDNSKRLLITSDFNPRHENSNKNILLGGTRPVDLHEFVDNAYIIHEFIWIGAPLRRLKQTILI